MGKLDTLAKKYMKRPDIFADVFNQFLYHGKQVIVPEQRYPSVKCSVGGISGMFCAGRD